MLCRRNRCEECRLWSTCLSFLCLEAWNIRHKYLWENIWNQNKQDTASDGASYPSANDLYDLACNIQFSPRHIHFQKQLAKNFKEIAPSPNELGSANKKTHKSLQHQ